MYAVYQNINKGGYLDGIWREPIWHGEEGYDQFENYKQLLDAIHDRNECEYNLKGDMGFFVRNYHGSEEFHKFVFSVCDNYILEEHFNEKNELVEQIIWKLFENEEDNKKNKNNR